MSDIFFWLSFIFLVGRAAIVFLCAAAIHDASKVPHNYIAHVSTQHWSAELERFATQLSMEKMALSGMHFFYLTRKTLLSV